MSHVLVSEVLDYAPAKLTALERLVLVVIAEAAQEHDRPGCPAREAYPSMATLSRRTGAAPTSVRSALQRLAERGLEVRVPLTTDSTGRPVYAFRGRATRYRLPRLRLQAEDGNDAASPLAEEGRHPSSASIEGRRRSVTPEQTTRRLGGDDCSSPYQEESEGILPQPPAQRPLPLGTADSEVRRQRSWAAVVSAARDSGIDEVDVEAVAARAIADPETFSAVARLRKTPGYAERLANAARHERLHAGADQVQAIVRPDSVECKHGTPGGGTPLQATGRPRCPVCRRCRDAGRHGTTP